MGIIYSDLKEKDEIRLLQLKPGSGSEPLRASIVHARLGESPTYDALSYMWGEDEPSTINQLLYFNDGRKFGLRGNLYRALRHLRFKDKVRTIWVDAICINQANDSERGHQVAQMGIIYSQATTVRIWLGSSDDSSRKAFDILEDPQVIHRLRQRPPNVSDWLEIAKLCRREYWGRLWIIQEIVLAARIVIHCGERALCWDKFSESVLRFEDDAQIVQNLGTDEALAAWQGIVDSAAMKICRQRKANAETGPITDRPSLLSLFWIYQDAKCLDIRDKIFGLHSFAPACCRSYIPVDYTTTAMSLCGRLLEHDIYHHPRRRHLTGMEDALMESMDLHELIIGGALKQNGSTNPFEIGSLVEKKTLTGNPKNNSGSQPANPFMVLGHYCGHITFVSPPLKSVFEGEEGLRVPESFVDSLNDLDLRLQDFGDPAFTKSITKALALVWRSQELLEETGESRSYLAPKLSTLESYKSIPVQCLSVLIKFVSEFLRTSEFLREETIYEDCVMFMSRSGSISWLGFAPVNTQIGDKIYTFSNTDIIAVIRERTGLLKIVGQGSRFDNLDSANNSPIFSTGGVSKILFNIPLLQAFSGKLTRRCDLPAYRAVMSVQPDLPKRCRQQTPVTKPVYLRSEREESPQYTARLDYVSTSSSSNISQRPLHPPRYVGPAESRYSCPRCKKTSTNARDNIIHASTWSHEQCKNCKCWTSWESKNTATTSTTGFCTQCRIDNPDCWVGNDADPDLEKDSQQSSSGSETEDTASTSEGSASSSQGSASGSTTGARNRSSTTSTTYDRLSTVYNEMMSEKREKTIPCLREEAQLLSRLMEFFEAVIR